MNQHLTAAEDRLRRNPHTMEKLEKARTADTVELNLEDIPWIRGVEETAVHSFIPLSGGLCLYCGKPSVDHRESWT